MGEKDVCKIPEGVFVDGVLRSYLETVDKEPGTKNNVMLTKAEVSAYLDGDYPQDVLAGSITSLLDVESPSPGCKIFSNDALALLKEKGLVIPKEARALGFKPAGIVLADRRRTYGISIPISDKMVWVPFDANDPSQANGKFERIEWDAKRKVLTCESTYELVEFSVVGTKITITEFEKKTKKVKTEQSYEINSKYCRPPDVNDISYDELTNKTNVTIAGVPVAAYKVDRVGKYVFLSEFGSMLVYDPRTKVMTLGNGWLEWCTETAEISTANGKLQVTVTNKFNDWLSGEPKTDTAIYDIEWFDNTKGDQKYSYIGSPRN
jgi:hypothetical protein